MSERVRGVAASLVAATLLAATPASAPADDAHALDPTWRRLARVARGEWRASSERRAAPGQMLPFAAEIRSAARRHGVSPTLLAALVRTESNFDRLAVSRAGARGLGQLMPLTAAELGVDDPFDARQNLDGAARYLARQLARFGNVRLALIAYHAGPDRVARGGWAIPDTSRRYARRVLAFESQYRAREAI